MIELAYSRSMPYDSKKARQMKTYYSSLARQAINFRTAYRNIQLLLLTNFDPELVDSVKIELTYDNQHEPKNRQSAKRYVQGFFDRLRYVCKMRGEPCLYLYNTEDHTADGEKCRIHHHVVLWCGKLTRDYDLLRSLWLAGNNVEIRPLGKDERYEKNMEELAKYLCKQRSPEAKGNVVGDKVCVGSRTLKRPVKHSKLIAETFEPSPPPGATDCNLDQNIQNEFGTYKQISYFLPVKK